MNYLFCSEQSCFVDLFKYFIFEGVKMYDHHCPYARLFWNFEKEHYQLLFVDFILDAITLGEYLDSESA